MHSASSVLYVLSSPPEFASELFEEFAAEFRNAIECSELFVMCEVSHFEKASGPTIAPIETGSLDRAPASARTAADTRPLAPDWGYPHARTRA